MPVIITLVKRIHCMQRVDCGDKQEDAAPHAGTSYVSSSRGEEVDVQRGLAQCGEPFGRPEVVPARGPGDL